jgi:Polyketide cyclase / dehydrase and lipid transport
MTILDHRILIPKSPEKVWEVLSDLRGNPSWQVDCSDVSLLTTRRTGIGVRWRYSTTSGREYVAETTAWYDGLGYEYTFVDGTPFRESKGRIRLQEIAEGTVVQWTLSYEMRGPLAGVRNRVSVKRQIESVMIDSLKTLWKVIQKAIPEDSPREIKSLMRDAPDYESRTQYRPRHLSTKSDTVPERMEQFSERLIVEPIISEDDTRPRIPNATTISEIQPDSPAVVSQIVTDIPEVFTPSRSESLVGLKPSDLPIAKIEEVVDKDASTQSTSRTTQEYEQVHLPIEIDSSSQPQPLNSSEDTSKFDTAEISVFDIFGLPRPSQTQQIQPVSVVSEILTSVNVITEIVPVVKRGRVGLRLQLRHRQMNVRQPK